MELTKQLVVPNAIVLVPQNKSSIYEMDLLDIEFQYIDTTRCVWANGTNVLL